MVRAEKGQFPFSIPQPRRSYQACTLLECGATSDCIASCKKFQIKAGAKTLRIHFGCDFDSVEASLSLTVLLLLKHPQTTHSLLSMRCGKLSHPDALKQAPTCCLYLCDYFADIALLERHFFLSDEKKRQCLKLVFTGLQNSRFLGDNGSRDTPPIDTSSALALSFAALSIGGVWSMMFYGTIQFFRCSPQLFFKLGS